MMRHVLLLGLALLAGCATSSYTPTSYFAVQPVIEVPKASPIDASLGLRPLEVAQPYLRGIVVREPDLEVVYLPNVAWAERPGDVLTRALTDALTATGHFSDVGDASNMFTPGYTLTGELRRYEGIKTTGAWNALCEVRIDVRKGMDRQPVWSDTLSSEVPLESNTAAALAKALSQAVTNVVTQAAEQIVAHTPASADKQP